jgi:hypothetical protein
LSRRSDARERDRGWETGGMDGAANAAKLTRMAPHPTDRCVGRGYDPATDCARNGEWGLM